ncbi:hypothetical protein JR316_0006382 [Psilocybe cubensis]|uniref:Uncharacterized protein n=1 Tax=Psilocybe cubensis TaxID=181762 RepID=A0ACB8H2D0_PSICU|nr:hypothetical protein JR316_0006382 [Psilocybe cubensis]KAH9481852.1 hypothetical protein JR316_0006382 [Psilocybe cubensis]
MSTEPDHMFMIYEHEKFWVTMQPFLLHRGYRLRPRYDPNWVPSWRQLAVLNDAVKLDNGQKVVLKKVSTDSQEIPLATLLSSKTWKEDPRNCSVPILDVIMIPGDDAHALLVMPQLLAFHLLPFRFFGEFSEFALQILQGLEFLHEHNVAHRDMCWGNIMMDISKVIPKGSHFSRWDSHTGIPFKKFHWKPRWTVQPVQYYIIDFGISVRCQSKDAKGRGRWGQDRTVPEMSKPEWCDIFMVDIYQLGNVFKECIEKYKGLDAFSELADAMTKTNPNDRPNAAGSVDICVINTIPNPLDIILGAFKLIVEESRASGLGGPKRKKAFEMRRNGDLDEEEHVRPVGFAMLECREVGVKRWAG